GAACTEVTFTSTLVGWSSVAGLGLFLVVILWEVLMVWRLDRAMGVGAGIHSGPRCSPRFSLKVSLRSSTVLRREMSFMLAPWWLVLIGILTGLITRTILAARRMAL